MTSTTTPSDPVSSATARHFTLAVAPGWEEALRVAGLASPAALLDASGELLGKAGLATWRQRVRLTLPVASDGPKGSGMVTCYLKRYIRPPAGARREVRRSRSGARSLAGIEWAWMTQLAADGIPAVRPIALAEEFDGRREIRSALLTQAVPGESLERLAARPTGLDRFRLRRLLYDTADLIARFHGRGYIHRDLYLSHIFYDPSAADTGAQGLRLIDLQRVLRPRWRRRRWIVKDLASLDYSTPKRVATTTDRVRWLKRYLGVPKLNAAARRLVRSVSRKTRRIARHDERRAGR